MSVFICATTKALQKTDDKICNSNGTLKTEGERSNATLRMATAVKHQRR